MRLNCQENIACQVGCLIRPITYRSIIKHVMAAPATVPTFVYTIALHADGITSLRDWGSQVQILSLRSIKSRS